MSTSKSGERIEPAGVMEHSYMYEWAFFASWTPANRYWRMMTPIAIDSYELERQHIVHAVNRYAE